MISHKRLQERILEPHHQNELILSSSTRQQFIQFSKVLSNPFSLNPTGYQFSQHSPQHIPVPTMPMLLRTLVRSASALRRPLPTRLLSSSHLFHSSTALQVSTVSPAAALETKNAAVQPDDTHVLTLLEYSIAQRRPTQALSHLAQLQSPPRPQLLQKLAVLLARQNKSRGHALRAFEILRGVYRAPGLKPDDYTKLASIYVMDACLRFRMLDSAMEVGASSLFMSF